MIANAGRGDPPGPPARPARPGPGAAGRRLVFGVGDGRCSWSPSSRAGRSWRRTPRRPWPARRCPRSARASAPAGPTCSTEPRRGADGVRARVGRRRGRLHHRPDPRHRPGHRLATRWPGSRPPRGRRRRARSASPPSAAPSPGPPARPRPTGPRAADAVAHRGPAGGRVRSRSGSMFGAAEVTTVAFADEHGTPSRAPGVLLAALGARQPARRRDHGRGDLPTRAHRAGPMGRLGARGRHGTAGVGRLEGRDGRVDAGRGLRDRADADRDHGHDRAGHARGPAHRGDGAAADRPGRRARPGRRLAGIVVDRAGASPAYLVPSGPRRWRPWLRGRSPASGRYGVGARADAGAVRAQAAMPCCPTATDADPERSAGRGLLFSGDAGFSATAADLDGQRSASCCWSRRATGSYGWRAASSAAYMIANALLAIVQGRLIDRLGQAPGADPGASRSARSVCSVLVVVGRGRLAGSRSPTSSPLWPARPARDGRLRPGPLDRTC